MPFVEMPDHPSFLTPDRPRERKRRIDWPAILGGLTAAAIIIPVAHWARSDPSEGGPWLIGVTLAAVAFCIIVRVRTGHWPS